MIPLNVEIDEAQASSIEEVLDRNPGWNKTLLVRALLSYFLKLEHEKQEDFVKKYSVRRSRRRKTG